MNSDDNDGNCRAKSNRPRVAIEDITAMGAWVPDKDLDIMYDEQW